MIEDTRICIPLCGRGGTPTKSKYPPQRISLYYNVIETDEYVNQLHVHYERQRRKMTELNYDKVKKMTRLLD